MERYNPDSKCPKCGWDKVSVKFCKGDFNCKSYMRDEWKYHLDRTCERCGYTWAEATLDKEAEK